MLEILNWARAHRQWTRRQWNQAVFTDESRFNLNFADRSILVWRRDGERMDPANVIQNDRFEGGSIMVWGGISNCPKTVLVTFQGNLNAARYCNEIVRSVLLPF